MTEKEIRESFGFKDEIIYHYCSLESMYGIFSSKSFWLTFLESSNDSSELKLAEKIIKESIQQIKNENLDVKDSDILKRILIEPSDKTYNKKNPRLKYYGLSLVEEKDSLTHWERYANNSGGVCIGLNIALIKNLFLIAGLPDINSYWLQAEPIIYSKKEQINQTKSLIKDKLIRLNSIFGGKENIEYEYTSIYYTTLKSLKPLFKYDGFASEKEHRIFLMEGEAEAHSEYINSISPFISEDNKELFEKVSKNIVILANELKLLKEDIMYHVFKDGIRSYYALNLAKIWSHVLIPEVVLGPKCFQNKKELKSFMKSCGLQKTKISVSKIPLR